MTARGRSSTADGCQEYAATKTTAAITPATIRQSSRIRPPVPKETLNPIQPQLTSGRPCRADATG